VIPVIIEATGTISKSLRQYLSNTPGKQGIKELQKKNSHIVHCTHTAESADVKVQNIFLGRNNMTCSTDCNYRTAEILYTLEA
jgi:ribosomal protein L34E